MKFLRICLGCLVILTYFMSVSFAGTDPGIPDTVKIEGGPLIVGQSVPLTLTIVNDSIVCAYSMGLKTATINGGFAIFDSAVYINRMADPSVLSFRIESIKDNDGVSPDSILFGGINVSGACLSIGNDPIAKLYYTGLSYGEMTVDSGVFPSPSSFMLVPHGGSTYTPEVIPLVVSVIGADLPPILTVTNEAILEIAGTSITFSSSGVSPGGHSLSFRISSLSGFDDSTLSPVNQPILSDENPAQFEWVTTSSDIGIWEAIIELCDSTGTCVSSSAQIQIVENSNYLVGFNIISYSDQGPATGIITGDFDNDNYLELFATLFPDGIDDYSPSARLYDFDQDANPVSTYEAEINIPKFGPLAGYFNGDQFLDIAVMNFTGSGEGIAVYELLVLQGDGNNSFTESGNNNPGNVTRSSTLGQFTGDNHLDIASTWYDGVHIYSGNSQSAFVEAMFIPTTDSALSVNSADFNGDGRDDLAVGTKAGINIYLAQPNNQFSHAYFYPQEYGSLDIEVTNRGSDFNDDNIYDMCISTPSVGGQRSEMIVYMGNGDGSFEGNITRNVRGQIFGNCVADFNNDGQLDIAFVNGALKYLSILFGDGQGNFPNEIRYPITHDNPNLIDCFDVDLDGDIDITILTSDPYVQNSIFVYLNQTNPDNFSQRSLDINIENNANLNIISPSGLEFNRVKNSMPSGIIYRLNLDDNDIIDALTQINLVEDGPYILEAYPRPELAPGNLFSIEFKLDDNNFRLAKNIPMHPDGYRFVIYPGNSSDIIPRPGDFTYAIQPTLMWPGDGLHSLQLSDDPDFGNLLLSAEVDGNSYTLDILLETSDTTTFYWRVKPQNQPTYEFIYAFNLIAGANSSCGDANSDGVVNIGDTIFLINLIFKGGPFPDPKDKGDANCDGKLNVADAVYILAYVFKGGDPPCCPE